MNSFATQKFNFQKVWLLTVVTKSSVLSLTQLFSVCACVCEAYIYNSLAISKKDGGRENSQFFCPRQDTKKYHKTRLSEDAVTSHIRHYCVQDPLRSDQNVKIIALMNVTWQSLGK